MIKYILCVMVFISPLSQGASCIFMENSKGQRISWKNNTPIVLHLSKGFPTQYVPTLKSAMKVWNRAFGYDVFLLSSKRTPSEYPTSDNVSTIYWLSYWDFNRQREQARTSVYWIGNRMLEADIRINARNFTFYTDVSPTKQAIHLESLIVHELGHVLGLEHNDSTPRSVMASSLTSNTKRNILTSDDISSILCEYK